MLLILLYPAELCKVKKTQQVNAPVLDGRQRLWISDWSHVAGAPRNLPSQVWALVIASQHKLILRIEVEASSYFIMAFLWKDLLLNIKTWFLWASHQGWVVSFALFPCCCLETRGCLLPQSGIFSTTEGWDMYLDEALALKHRYKKIDSRRKQENGALSLWWQSVCNISGISWWQQCRWSIDAKLCTSLVNPNDGAELVKVTCNEAPPNLWEASTISPHTVPVRGYGQLALFFHCY